MSDVSGVLTYSPEFCFEPHASAYSPVNAFSLAQAARLAYANNPDQEAVGQLDDKIRSQVVNGWAFNNYHFLAPNEKDTQGFIMGNDQIIVLVFRGTTSIQDWLTNLDIALTEACEGRVHRGFWEALEIVWAEIIEKLSEFRDNNQRVFITGHSLGAALATLATARLLQDDTKQDWVKGLYTFGSPRVGDSDFAAWFDRQFRNFTFRFVNNCDVVTQVALKTALSYKIQYDHVGLIKYFDLNGCLRDEIFLWKCFKTSFKLQVSARMLGQRLKHWGAAQITALRNGTLQTLGSADFTAYDSNAEDADVQLPINQVVQNLFKLSDHKIEKYVIHIQQSALPREIASGASQSQLSSLPTELSVAIQPFTSQQGHRSQPLRRLLMPLGQRQLQH